VALLNKRVRMLSLNQLLALTTVGDDGISPENVFALKSEFSREYFFCFLISDLTIHYTSWKSSLRRANVRPIIGKPALYKIVW